MKASSTNGATSDSILREVWMLKDENAAAHGYDVEAIAEAARRHQQAHGRDVVRRPTAAKTKSSKPID